MKKQQKKIGRRQSRKIIRHNFGMFCAYINSQPLKARLLFALHAIAGRL